MAEPALGRAHPYGELLGMEHDPAADGPGHMRVMVREELKNPHGVVHGGVIYSLIDTCMGHTIVATLDDSESCTTIEIKVSYMRPVTAGTLHGAATLIRRGARVAFVESEVHDDAGKLVAKATGTFAIFPRP